MVMIGFFDMFDMSVLVALSCGLLFPLGSCRPGRREWITWIRWSAGRFASLLHNLYLTESGATSTPPTTSNSIIFARNTITSTRHYTMSKFFLAPRNPSVINPQNLELNL